VASLVLAQQRRFPRRHLENAQVAIAKLWDQIKSKRLKS
jgi:hypothetical protein